MAHNNEAGDSGTGGQRSRQLSLDEADIMYWHRIPVPLEFKLPHGWHMSHAGYAVPPAPPDGAEMRSLIDERRAHMSSAERSQSDNAPTSSRWRQHFLDERDIEVARSAGHEAGRYKCIGRRAWRYGRDVDETLAFYGYRPRVSEDGERWPIYFPQSTRMAPAAPPLRRPPPPPKTPATRAPARSASGSSRSGSSGSGGRHRSTPYSRPSGGVVIRDGPRRASASSAPARRTASVKKEVKMEPGSLPFGRLHLRQPKDEEDAPPPPPPAKRWWEMELETQAAYRGPDDPKDAPGQHLLVGRSIDEDYRQIPVTARQSEPANGVAASPKKRSPSRSPSRSRSPDAKSE